MSAEVGDAGTNTGNSQVGVEPLVGAGTESMTGLVFGAVGGDYGNRSRYRGKGGG